MSNIIRLDYCMRISNPAVLIKISEPAADLRPLDVDCTVEPDGIGLTQREPESRYL